MRNTDRHKDAEIEISSKSIITNSSIGLIYALKKFLANYDKYIYIE